MKSDLWRRRALKIRELIRHPRGLVKLFEARVLPTSEYFEILSAIAPDFVIDVGCNRGQFSLAVLTVAPDARILAFEPNPPVAHEARSMLGAHGDVTVLERALGSEAATLLLHFDACQDDGASILSPVGRRADSSVLVPVDTLDTYVSEVVDTKSRCVLLKLDVQGLELEVLMGGETFLEFVDWVLIECAFHVDYAGQARIEELFSHLAQHGFTLDSFCGMSGSRTRMSSQFDALFRRTVDR